MLCSLHVLHAPSVVAFARPALGCAHTVGFTDVFIARDGPPQQQHVLICIPSTVCCCYAVFVALCYVLFRIPSTVCAVLCYLHCVTCVIPYSVICVCWCCAVFVVLCHKSTEASLLLFAVFMIHSTHRVLYSMCVVLLFVCCVSLL